MQGKMIIIAVNTVHIPVLKDTFDSIDQINVMCYDFDWGLNYAWYVGALHQNGNPNAPACDEKVYAFVDAGIPRTKLGVGMPLYARKWYGATKAFVTSFTEAVHEELKGTGVSVTVLCPGFTHTEFQERANVPAASVPGFMWQEAPEVAAAGLDGVAKNRAVVIPGTMNKVMGNFSAITPHAITRRLGGAVLKRAGH